MSSRSSWAASDRAFWGSGESFPWTGLIVISLLYGGVPYLVGAAGLWFWMRGKAPTRIALVSYLTPIILLPLFLVWMGFIFGFRDLPREPVHLLAAAAYISAFWLSFGYCYVVLVHVARFVGESLGWLT